MTPAQCKVDERPFDFALQRLAELHHIRAAVPDGRFDRALVWAHQERQEDRSWGDDAGEFDWFCSSSTRPAKAAAEGGTVCKKSKAASPDSNHRVPNQHTHPKINFTRGHAS